MNMESDSMKLASLNPEKRKVIEEARAFVGNNWVEELRREWQAGSRK